MSRQSEAALLLQLYELRREPSLRDARAWFVTRFVPAGAEEIVDLMRSGFAESARYRMVTTYWDMACALVVHGAIGAAVFHDANTEHLAVYAKLEPHLAGVRSAFGLPRYLASLEGVATSAPGGEDYFPKIRGLMNRWAERADQTRQR
jgi:hypothetical protein